MLINIRLTDCKATTDCDALLLINSPASADSMRLYEMEMRW